MTEETASARNRLLEAFNRLVMRAPGRRPALADVIAEAGVARSTLYDHFQGRDDLLLEALKSPLSVIAAAATGPGNPDKLAGVLAHFYERRKEAADLLAGPLQSRIAQTLAGQISERSGPLTPKAALQLATMLLSLIHLWLTGRAASTASETARLVQDTAHAQFAVLTGQRNPHT